MIWTVKNSTPSSRNPMFYNISKVEQGEAEIVAIRNFKDDKFGTIYRTLLERDTMAIRTEKPSVHMVLSGDEGETLTDEQAVELIEKNLKDVDIASQPHVIVRHDDTEHVHYHVFSTKVREDGKSIVWNGIGRRLVHSLSKYQEEYGYVASQDLHRKKEQEKAKKTGLNLDSLEQFSVAYSSALSVEEVSNTLLGKGIKMTEFVSKHTGDPMIRLSQKGKRPVYTKAESMLNSLSVNQRKRLEEIARQPVAFIIRNEMDATLYVHRQMEMTKTVLARQQKLDEAARSILKYRTWSASIRHDDPEGFMSEAAKAKMFGTVQYDLAKARFIEEESGDGILENPVETITFRDAAGRVIDLITSEFTEYWTKLVRNVREAQQRRIEHQRLKQLKQQKKERSPHL